MTTYKVLFKGEIDENKDQQQIGLKLARYLKIPETKANLLFNGRTYAIKKGLEFDKACLVQKKLQSVGIITECVAEKIELLPAPISEGDCVKESPPVELVEKSTELGGVCPECGSKLNQESGRESEIVIFLLKVLSNKGYVKYLTISSIIHVVLLITGVFSAHKVGFIGWVTFLIVGILFTSAGAYLGSVILNFVKPDAYYASGFVDALYKKIFWKIGPQVIGFIVGFVATQGFLVNSLGLTQFR